MQLPKIISQSDFQALTTEKETLSAKVTSLETELSTAKLALKAVATEYVSQADHGAAVAKLATDHTAAIAKLTGEHTSALDALKKEYETKISDLTNKLQAAETSSEAKARKALNEIGIASDELPKVTNKQDKTQVLEEVSKLQGYELANYLYKNKQAVAEALKQQTKR